MESQPTGCRRLRPANVLGKQTSSLNLEVLLTTSKFYIIWESLRKYTPTEIRFGLRKC